MKSTVQPTTPGRQLSGNDCIECAFTLIELLVVICVVALIAAALVPTFAGSRIGSQAFRCQNNNCQLASAWRMYADDSNDRVVYASNSGSTPDYYGNGKYAWSQAHMDSSGANRANWDTNYEIVKGPLWPYTGQDASIYKCPSDSSFVVYLGTVRPRVRSFSVNLYVGGFAPASGSGPDGNDGGWPFASPYRIFAKTTSLSAPGPAQTFVFVDMRPESINWGNFATDMTGFPNNPSQYAFTADYPGIYHNVGASISFADGRAEVHRWVDPRTAPPSAALSPNTPSVPSPGNQDIAWLQAHSTSPK